MNIVIFDTETTSLEKPFTYNIGYKIVDADTNAEILRREFVVEQVWQNMALFTTAYYADKRPIYVKAMRGKRAVLDKYGYICKIMSKDFRQHKVAYAYAYNSPFDEKAFNFNCDWFRCNNPFDTTPIIDIRGCVHEFLVNDDYKEFCEKNGYFTESGNYSTTAEIVYRYLFDNSFVEAHTALADADIEAEILKACFDCGAEVGVEYPVQKSVWRNIPRTLEVKDKYGTIHTFDYTKKIATKNGEKIYLH